MLRESSDKTSRLGAEVVVVALVIGKKNNGSAGICHGREDWPASSNSSNQ
jgi:hypothetical protein